MCENRSKIVIGLGGNLKFQGSPTATSLANAVHALAAEGLVIRSVSRFFSTPCFPAGAGPDYVNAAISVETELAPKQLLARLHRVEALFDRERAQRWGMRTLDADLLAYDQMILPDLAEQGRWLNLPAEDQIKSTPKELILPHPRLQDRAFALVPMADIVPDWRHPVLHKSVRELCAQLPESDILSVRLI